MRQRKSNLTSIDGAAVVVIAVESKGNTVIEWGNIAEPDVDMQMMMSIGGWSDYPAIEPYLGEATGYKIGRSTSA